MSGSNNRPFRGAATGVALLSILALWNSAPAAAQQAGVQQKQAALARDRALVEQFWPHPLLLDRQSARRTPEEDDLAFLTADLNGTGEREFIIAAYSGGDIEREAILVLRKTGDSAVIVDEIGYTENSTQPKRIDLGGWSPQLSLIDVDGSGQPAVLFRMGTVRGIGGTLLLKWDGISLKPVPGTTQECDGVECTLLDDVEFVDLDGDGKLEIVDVTSGPTAPEDPEPEKAEQAEEYPILKLIHGRYVSVGKLECYVASDDVGLEFVASKPGAPYVMIVANGDGRGKPPADEAEIFLNGTLIAGPDKVNATSRYLRIPISVKAENTLKIKVTGREGATVYVAVGRAESALISPEAAAKGKQ